MPLKVRWPYQREAILMCRMSVYTPRADFGGSGSQRTACARAFLGSLSCMPGTTLGKERGDRVAMTICSSLKECCRSFEDPQILMYVCIFRA
jgi:hypothetical protein